MLVLPAGAAAVVTAGAVAPRTSNTYRPAGRRRRFAGADGRKNTALARRQVADVTPTPPRSAPRSRGPAAGRVRPRAGAPVSSRITGACVNFGARVPERAAPARGSGRRDWPAQLLRRVAVRRRGVAVLGLNFGPAGRRSGDVVVPVPCARDAIPDGRVGGSCGRGVSEAPRPGAVVNCPHAGPPRPTSLMTAAATARVVASRQGRRGGWPVELDAAEWRRPRGQVRRPRTAAAGEPQLPPVRR